MYNILNNFLGIEVNNNTNMRSNQIDLISLELNFLNSDIEMKFNSEFS